MIHVGATVLLPPKFDVADTLASMERERVTGIHNFSLDTHKARLVELRTQEADLLSRYQDDYPALENVRRVARSNDNLMPALIEAAHAYATLGEITDVLKNVFGVQHFSNVV